MAVPQLQFKDCELDSITLSWSVENSPMGRCGVCEEILVSDYAGCRSIVIAPEQSSSTEMSTKVTGLNPSSSYIFRLYTIAADGQEVGPGPEIAFDTEVVSCAPTNKSCCTIS
ncbi:unnamed protein product [Ectocarpus sp. 6 AP-2014]